MKSKRGLVNQVGKLVEAAVAAPSGIEIASTCIDIASVLVQKNRDYGDSVLDPVRVFSKGDTVEQILVRLDDKLSRLKRGNAGGEDVELDLIGYLVLLRIAKARASTARRKGR